MPRKLNNIKSDRDYLHNILSNGCFPKATFTVWISLLPSSLTLVDYTGEVTKIDLESGYCDWNNKNGIQMPEVNINCITLLQT